jgi:hypothetical protein
MLNYSANGPSGYNLTNSLRFRASNSAFLSRTPASAGNRRTWTWSGWVKRGQISIANNGIFSAGTSFGTNNNNLETISFPAADTLEIASEIGGSTQYRLITTQVFRDPSAWYHIIVAVDTTQATASNRIKLYVNGSQVTAFGTSTYPSQNYDCWTNSTNAHRIGSRASPDFDGYMDEINFIDGQALTPSSFGNTNAVTGVWQPAKYTGTYGTNGFYLNFTDIALTSGSNAGLGKDFSGNGNYWNTNNISVTAGSTYDAMSDVPTLTSTTTANYAVISPIDSISASGTLSSANLNWASSTSVCGNRASIGATSGKWYWEAVGSSVTSGTIGGRFAFTGSDTTAVEQDKFGMYWHPTSGIARIVNGTNTYVTSAYTYTNSDVLALALDLDNNISYWYKNGVLQYTYDFSSFSTIGTRTFFPYVWNASSGTPSWVYNFGQRAFSYTPPTGYNRLNTFNLPTSTIVKGNTVMDATAYTGTNGSPTTQVISSNFQPDFLWFKKRSASYDHALIDTNRGITKQLYSNLMNAEGTDSDVLTAIGASSFTVGNSNYSNYGTLVAWTWKANAGSTSSNTQGSITSTVQANTTAGFSIITYTGNGVPNATVGHGLGIQPNLIIVKQRTGTADNWAVSVKLSNLTVNRMYLNSNIADNGTDWIGASSTLLTLKLSDNFVNANGNTYVSYCWASIEGFSRIGSYTGNGSSDGTFVYTGFRPKYIMIKSSSIAGEWAIYDVPRDLYNPMGLGGGRLQANTSNAETGADSAQYIDFLSNGFKIRNTSGFDNQSGATYIFAAFASNPFKNSLAF